jgi:hypothetical protein
MGRALFFLFVCLLLAVACDPGRGLPDPNVGLDSVPPEDTVTVLPPDTLPGDAGGDTIAPDTAVPGDDVLDAFVADVGGDTEDGGPTPDVPPLDLAIPDLPPGVSPALQFNEVTTRDPTGGEDWFELIATGDEAVLLSDYAVVDGDPNHLLEPLPDIWMDPGEIFVVKAISAADWSPYPHVPFKLGSNDGLTLVKDGELVDRVEWYGQAPPEGTTLCRLDPGEPPWQLCKPTPNQPNEDVELKLSTCYDPFLWDRVTPVHLNLGAGAWQAMLAAPEAEEYHAGDLQFGPIQVNDVAIRIKGGNSIAAVAQTGTQRFSFKIDLNEYVPLQKLCGLKKLVLHNGWGDPSLLREHLAYRLARALDLPAPRTAFVDLTVEGVHLGVYLMVEPVDDDFFLKEHFADDNGDLYQADAPAGSLEELGDVFADYPGLAAKNNQDTTNHAALLTFINVLNHGTPQEWPAVLRVKDALRYLAWNTVLTNLDSYNGSGANYYLYEQQGVFTLLPWDADEAFGGHGCGCTDDALLAFAVDEPTCGPLAARPLLQRLLSVPAHASKYREYVEDLLAGGFAPATFALWTEAAAAVIRPELEEGSYFQDIDAFEAALLAGAPGGPFGLQAFVDARNLHLSAQLGGTEQTTHGGQGNCTSGTP